MAGNYYPNMHMSAASFRPISDSLESDYANQSNFELSDFFEFDDCVVPEDSAFVVSGYPQPPYAANYEVVNPTSEATTVVQHEGPSNEDRRNGQVRERVAFKTKSQVEILDDGFKWRKYGKKMVKNSPNPRNYYRCSVDGCPVKKRVERDGEDPRYVITTYEGIHNHQGPDIRY